ncbi:NnrS family protein [Ruixingdingia sedimenti]|uniref:NnrS family protein n=1 Tax=Ruixingdingia sedimenti TaxID=3073604 RepID=A0ABU1FAW8_9RHOB|nr:NnrS family protein [Xinfangfangia sp. LG-4]MDR5654034.1 NnrS family protein [Xinfangfangia sp. LG-4]
MSTSAELIRGWTGPAVLSFGFRPFFFMAGAWAVVAMLLWLPMLTGHLALPTGFDPVAWHAHEFVFGYTSAVIAGFLLTAVPNWTGRLPVVGWRLGGLAALWLAGRLAVAFGALLPSWLVLVADLAMMVALALFLGREIVAGKNWRNLPVLGLLLLFLLANAVFHAESWRGDVASDGFGLRFGLAAVLMLIGLIGGRIIPSFTRNWLAQRRATRLPVPFGRADGAVMALTGLALAGFVALPLHPLTAALCGLAGLAQLWRLSRWQGGQTGAEPLLWVLHLAYAFYALGFLSVAAAAVDWLPQAGARHVWLAGAIGLMTLAVMTRASLGHAGRPLHAGPWVAACYVALALAVVTRFASGLMPAEVWLLHLSAGFWLLAFGGFAVIYAPILLLPRAARKQAMRRA